MRGVILAAGEGTRMRPITYWRPKPLVPIACKPLIGHIIEGFVRAGVTQICIVVGYRRHQLIEALGDGGHWGAHLTYVVQPEPRGTGAALLLAADFLAGEQFMLSWGDILVPADHYSRVRRALADDVHGVLSVNWTEDPWEGAAVYVRGGLVTRIIEKPPKGHSSTNYNNAGIFILPPDILDIAQGLQPSERGEVELPDAIATFIASGGRLRAVEVQGYWSDVARPANVIEMSGRVMASAGPPAAVHPHARLDRTAILRPPVYIGPAVHIGPECELGPNVAVCQGAEIGAGTRVDNSVIGARAKMGGGARLSHCYVEETSEVPEGTVLVAEGTNPLVLPPSGGLT